MRILRGHLFPLLFLVSSVLEAEVGAYEVLQKVRRAYAAIPAYADRGEIEVVEHGRSSNTTRLRFETRFEDETFLLRISGEGFERILRRERGQSEIRLDDLVLAQYQQPATLREGLFGLLGQDGIDALQVASALIRSPSGLPDPEAAAFEGEEPCGDTTCYLLFLSRLQSTHETLLWIDRESFLIRRLEIESRPGAGLREALRNSGLAEAGGVPTPHPRKTIRVLHEVLPAEDPASLLGPFLPPEETRLVEAWQMPADEAGYGETASTSKGDLSPGGDPSLVFDDMISVELFRIITRVATSRGQPVLGLGPEDFEARVAGREIPVVSVDWITSDPDFRDEALEVELARHGVEIEPTEQLVILFVQAGLHASRIKGHLRTLPMAQSLIDSFHPNDRLAVVSFDSRLKLWKDFTRRHSEIRELMEKVILFGGEPRLEYRSAAAAGPSLAAHFDFRAARNAASPEKALEVLGRTLAEVPGEKTMVYLGWGMGRFGSGGVKMTPEYEPAVRALHQARTSVFVLDVTDAGYHSLEVGLQKVATQTGGTYAKTSLFGDQAVERLGRLLSGYYILAMNTADLPEKRGLLRLRLKDKKKGSIISDQFKIEGIESSGGSAILRPGR